MGIDTAEYLVKIIFSYAISQLKIKDKVRFYYALKGRDGKSGIIKFYNIDQLGKTVLLVDKKHEPAKSVKPIRFFESGKFGRAKEIPTGAMEFRDAF